MKAKAVVLLGLLLLTPPTTFAAKWESGAGIVYGKKYAFLINAPAGWILDNESAASQGIYAVFYPKGSSWSKAPAVMYANAANKTTGGITNVQKLIDLDVAKFKKKNPKIVITEGQPLKTADGKIAQVRLFRGDQWGNHEAVAYIDEPTIVAILVLTSRSQTAFKESLPAFEKLVASYRFYTDNVKISNSNVKFSKPKDHGSKTPK